MRGDPGGEPTDHYSFGYEEGVQSYLQLHTAERCAGFIQPHLTQGMSLLDAGCGPGTITIGLAQLVTPGPITAVDVSAGEVEKTRQLLIGAGFDNAQTAVADVRNLQFEAQSFDAVFSHAVIDYLDDPVAALREFHRVLKPGGLVGVRSPNDDLMAVGPANALLDEGLALFRQALSFMGGNVSEGRFLGSRLKDAGFERIFVSSSFEQAQSREEWPGFIHAFASGLDGTRVAEIIVQQGWADRARIEKIIAEFESFGTDSSNYLGFPWTSAIGFKPTDSAG
jgi:SAM-dependent methyltransferase